MERFTSCLILIWIILSSGCAYVAPVASVIGAGASTTSAYYAVKSADAKYTVIGADCLWYEDKRLDEQSKASMTREDKEWLGRNRCNYFKLCPGKEVPEQCRAIQ